MRLTRSLLVVISVGVLLTPAIASPAYAAVTRVRAGSATDVSRTSWSGPAFTMNGSGAVVPDTMASAINEIRGGTGTLDVVVLAASAATGTPECDAITALAGVNSCTTYTLTAASDGNNAQVNTDIRNAEFVYFAGGDQCKYVAWKGTALEASVESVVAKGGGAGGGSAGVHVNSDIVYDACGGSATSATALANPYGADMTFTYGMFGWPNYLNTINDSHFVTRDRMGRSLAFVARALKDGKTSGGKAYGVGIEQGGSLYINHNGLATLSGQNAYVILGDHQPEQAVSGKPLTYSNYKIWQLTPGMTYDFKNRPTCGYYLKSVTNGVPSTNLYSGTPDPSCSTGGGGTGGGGTGGGGTGGGGTGTGGGGTGGGGTGSSTFTEAEPNDSRTAANDISGSGHPVALTGSMATSSDRDYFKESLAAGATITVNCTIPPAYDADLYFMNSSGSTLTRSVNSGAGAAESLTYTNSGGAGTFYVDLEAYSGSGSATYTCTVTK